MAKDCDSVATRLVFIGQEGASHSGRHAQDFEVVCGHTDPGEPLRLASSRKSEVTPFARCHVLEGLALLPPSHEIKGRDGLAVPSPPSLGGVSGDNHDHPGEI